jgi:hypothetical protein
MIDANSSSLSMHIHDAEISLVAIDREKAICRFEFLHNKKNCSILNLSGLRAYRVQDFVMQNVVSRVLTSSTSDFSIEEIKYWIEWATSLSDAGSWLKPGKLDTWLAAIDAGKLKLLVFEPSAGAQIAAIFEQMNFQISLHED